MLKCFFPRRNIKVPFSKYLWFSYHTYLWKGKKRIKRSVLNFTSNEKKMSTYVCVYYKAYIISGLPVWWNAICFDQADQARLSAWEVVGSWGAPLWGSSFLRWQGRNWLASYLPVAEYQLWAGQATGPFPDPNGQSQSSQPRAAQPWWWTCLSPLSSPPAALVLLSLTDRETRLC